MHEVSYEDFCLKTNIKNDKNLYIFLIPDEQIYLKSNQIYFAVTINAAADTLQIVLAIGKSDLTPFADIKKYARTIGVKSMTWVTSEKNGRMKKISNFYRAVEKTRLKNYYQDNSDGIVYRLIL